jgi:uncharacterized protein
VLIELERRRFDVTYVRTSSGREVDFLARNAQGQEELIQVCADASDPETAEREVRSLHEAAAQHPRAVKRLLTATQDGAPAEAEPDILVQPAYEWLLSEPDPA